MTIASQPNMLNQPIPQFEPFIGPEEYEAMRGCFDARWLSGGPRVKEFESMLATLQDSKYAVACCNGTLAIYLAVVAVLRARCPNYTPLAHEYWPWRAIVPDFTFVATANAVIMAGGLPTFVDIEKFTYNLSPARTAEALTPDTEIIMPVHIYGQAANMEAFTKIATDAATSVIEDAAQGVGVNRLGKGVGSWGTAGTLSFYADKTITTGEGGMVLTDDVQVHKNLISLANQGRQNRGIYYHEEVGYNFRMTDYTAAIGLAQLKKLGSIISAKKYIRSLYYEQLKGIPQVAFPYEDPASATVPFRVNILVPYPAQLQTYLASQKIASTRFFYPLHLQPCYKELVALQKEAGLPTDFPNSVDAYEHGLSLPSAASLTGPQIERVTNAIYNYYRRQ